MLKWWMTTDQSERHLSACAAVTRMCRFCGRHCSHGAWPWHGNRASTEGTDILGLFAGSPGRPSCCSDIPKRQHCPQPRSRKWGTGSRHHRHALQRLCPGRHMPNGPYRSNSPHRRFRPWDPVTALSSRPSGQGRMQRWGALGCFTVSCRSHLMHASGIDGMLVLQAPPGASPTGGMAAQLLIRTREQSLEGAGAEVEVGMAGLPMGVAEDEVPAGSLIYRLGRLCSPYKVYRLNACMGNCLVALQ